jgi:hypothetical protein
MGNVLMFINQTFKHKGFVIDIRCEADHNDASTVKAYHHIYSDDGTMVLANITPYDTSQLTVKMWIDAGMPERQWVNGVSVPFTREDLEILLELKEDI